MISNGINKRAEELLESDTAFVSFQTSGPRSIRNNVPPAAPPPPLFEAYPNRKRQAKTHWEFSTALVDSLNASALAYELGCNSVEAAGYIALLYSWCVANAFDDGNINAYTVRSIEEACRWKGSRGQLVAAMINARVLKGMPDSEEPEAALTVVGWETIAAKIIQKRESARARKARERAQKSNN